MALMTQPCVSPGDSHHVAKEESPARQLSTEESEEVKLLTRFQELHNELELLETKLAGLRQQAEGGEKLEVPDASQVDEPSNILVPLAPSGSSAERPHKPELLRRVRGCCRHTAL